MLDEYRIHEAERAALGIPPRPLSAAQTESVVAALTAPPDEAGPLLGLLTNRVSPGVGEAAEVKARFLAGVTRGVPACPSLDPAAAVRLLGTMLGGYNILPLVA